MEQAHLLVELENAVALMTQAVAQADPTAPVLACPGWTVADLIDHVGCVHLWAAQAARSGARPDPFPVRDQGDRTLARWYADCGRELVETLGGLDPTASTWTFAAKNRTVGFWYRRQLHETTVHWVDVLLAAEQPIPQSPELTTDVAADGVDEVLTFFMPGQLRRTGAELATKVTAPIVLSCTDAPAAWQVDVAPDAAAVRRLDRQSEPNGTSDHVGGSDQDVANDVGRIAGSAVALYLALWNRCDRAELSVSGNTAAARAFLDATLVP